ncbi:hypothetical protein GBAR_LOCUS20471 [Geodia barretti]|uniref:Uncharacterized protein n=1 Tax=Geodia barretti TaxID=519541 RepID=A0AA35SUR8_GEOBA|nr:hypothetical protein GBAR_LOCUS20471 [Geodia barretti]
MNFDNFRSSAVLVGFSPGERGRGMYAVPLLLSSVVAAAECELRSSLLAVVVEVSEPVISTSRAGFSLPRYGRSSRGAWCSRRVSGHSLLRCPGFPQLKQSCGGLCGHTLAMWPSWLQW